MTLEASPARAAADGRTKRTLFCPTCGHESAMDDGWIDDDGTERRRLLCPGCGDTVVDRPRP
ncbi:hypothetical protein [Haloarcula salina]|uniref:DUF8106 domain-containing protein n=1 Tax=Haloarcula salina TaxID=1429914 RepID=A0AA41KGX0_9EURY|nr:hypothetical protein [Haloarcula salina]MBV0903567.1 hypothetical protein [Haloarcula salina]